MTSRPPLKRYGQNFLHDAGVIGRILDCLAPAADDHFVEIGPGTGAITRPLADRVARVDAIEIDRGLADDLRAEEPPANLQVHTADALRFDFSELAKGPASLRLVGNLPYNVSTPLLFRLLGFSTLFRDLHVMLQKEVVDRMCARPGSREWGRLSVSLAAHCRIERLFTIRAGAFRPAPRVQSAFARLTPLPEPLVAPAEAAVFAALVRQGFNQRRKQLGNSLRPLLSADLIRAAGIDPMQRAGELDVAAWVRLAHAAAGGHH